LTKHLLIEGVDFTDIGRKYFVAASMRELFENVDPRNIIDFIKEAGFYHCTL